MAEPDDEQELVTRIPADDADDADAAPGSQPLPPPRSLPELVATLAARHQAAVAAAERDPASPYFRQLADGWVLAWTRASLCAGAAAQPSGNPHRQAAEQAHRLAALLAIDEDRLRRAEAVGQFDAVRIAVRMARQCRDVLVQAEQAARTSVGANPANPAERSMWDGYPVAVHDDEVIDDMVTLARFLGGDTDSFTHVLLGLIAKSDPNNLNRLASAYPHEVRAFIMWRSMAPIHAHGLIRLLRATEDLGRLSR